MGLGNVSPQTEEEDDNQSDDDSKVSYIYVRSDENKEAYDLMSTSLGGDAEVRDWLKNRVPDALFANQHDFFQQFIVALDDVQDEDDYEEVLDLLMVPADQAWDHAVEAHEDEDEDFEVSAELVARLLDNDDDLMAEVEQRLKSTQAPADDD